MHQGIYAISNFEILGFPKICAGIRGSARIRVKRPGEKSSCLEDGEICGVMHWADLVMKYSTEVKFDCFADPVGPLIINGWEVVPAGEGALRVQALDGRSK